MFDYRILFGLVLLSFIFAGCVLPGATASVDAIAVWQHKNADSWDIYYSLWDHDAKQWGLPAGAKSAPIAIDEGDDHDPDVSSNDRTAIALWAKEGKGIYYSVWENFVWTVPASLSDDRADSDPTVAVDQNGNALAVWVTGKTSLYYSYYKSNIGWTTPERIKLEGLSAVSLPELAASADGGYYLVFTGTEYSGSNNAYGMVYSTSTGWSSPLGLGSDAKVDNGMPTSQRTGVSAAETRSEATMVWPGSTKVYAAVFGASASGFDTGQMPDTSYDASEAAHGTFTQGDDLYHQPDVNSPASTNLVSSMKESDERSSLVFIRDRKPALVLWWTEVLGPGQIYYSYYENGNWFGVAQVDPALASAEDRNPAVSPLRSFLPLEETGDAYCGDKVLQVPEQCEVGIACPNANDVCIIPPCICRPPVPPQNGTLDCSVNTFIPNPFGISLLRPGMICKDDCAATFGKGWTCDMKACACEKKAPPPTDVSCAVNTRGMAAGAASKFKAGLICKDDCKTLGADYVCDMKSCICDKKPAGDLSCTRNTEGMATGAASQFKPGMICRDDCKNNLGSSYYCDAVSCVCKKSAGEDYYCAGNSIGAALTGINMFNPAQDVCRDNCDALGDGYKCNMKTCICEEQEKAEVSCNGRKLHSMLSSSFGGPGPAAFNPATMSCKDDCADSHYCDMKSCQCEPRELRHCAAGKTDEIMPDLGLIGSDILSMGLTGTGATGPVTVGRAPDPSASSATGTVDTEIVSMDLVGSGPLGPVTLSPDSFFDVFVELDLPGDSGTGGSDFPVDSFFDVFFELELPGGEPTATPDSFFDVFTDFSIPTQKPFSPSSMICKDNCEVLGPEYECDMKACRCDYKPKTDYSCFGNTMGGVIELGGNASGGFNPSAHICKDDCKEIGAVVGGEWKCNMKTCVCEPEPTHCKANTFEQINSGSTGYSWLLGICKDDCKELGEGYTCDPFSCVCRKKPDTKVYCDANTMDAYVEDSTGRAQTSRFDPSTQQCVDNCKERFGENTKCDPVSCYCVPGEGIDITCAEHTDLVSVTDVNKFDASSMRCEDDCKGNWGEEYYCNLQSCTCSKSKPPEELACSSRQEGKTTTVSAAGKICKDDCAQTLGSEWECVTDGCYCRKKPTEIIQISCAGNAAGDLDPAEEGYFCLDDCKGKVGLGYYCDLLKCQCVAEEIGICGDGALDYGEDCDYGSASTNKCPTSEGETYKYCTEGCLCKDIEHTPRCGDGKITGTEGCDGGNVKTAICSEGYKCYTPECKCVPLTGSGQCGDGTVTAPEECDHGNSFTEQCPGGNYCENCRCVSYAETSHKECDYDLGECVETVGPGEDQCMYDYQCEVDEEPGAICGNDVREGSEQCDGMDDLSCDRGEFCSQDCRCVGETITMYCGDGVVNLNEQCEKTSDCNVEMGEACIACQCMGPPVVNCASWCTSQGYSSVVRGTYADGQACLDSMDEDEVMCQVTCVYAGFGKWSNPAGSTTCCCKDVYREPCTMLPTGGCDCPDEQYVDDVLCPAHAP